MYMECLLFNVYVLLLYVNYIISAYYIILIN